MWQHLHDELAPFGFTVVAIAVDADLDAVAEWATAEPLSFPVLVDPDFAFAEAYGIVNVPASVWVDEHDRIVRPADVAMGDDRFRDFSHVDSAVHHDLLREWVRTGRRDLDDDAVRAFQERPTTETQQARLHRRIALALRDQGDHIGMAEHLAVAEALAPMDWTIRRGNLPMKGEDPFGEQFFAFVGEWIGAGQPGYRLGTGRESDPTG